MSSSNLKLKEGWKSLSISQKEVQLKLVLACGQSFRWKRNSERHSEWTGVFGHHVWTLKQSDTTEDSIYYKVHNNQKTDGREKVNFESLLINYFQLEVSLAKLYQEWAERDPKFEALTLKDYQGIRILRQDPIETIFAFICSSNNNISRISQMVDKLCVNYGEELTIVDGENYYDFPTVERLAQNDVEKKLREEGFGYRAAYIVNSAKKIVEYGGAEWAAGLVNVNGGYDEARKELQSLPGIGRKVADCICLMALGYHKAIPVDTHMHEVGKQYLPHLAKVKTLTEKVYKEISEYFEGIYGDYAGWAHSVLFASTLKHLKANDCCHSAENKTNKAKRKTEEKTSRATTDKPATKRGRKGK